MEGYSCGCCFEFMIRGFLVFVGVNICLFFLKFILMRVGE